MRHTSSSGGVSGLVTILSQREPKILFVLPGKLLILRSHTLSHQLNELMTTIMLLITSSMNLNW